MANQTITVFGGSGFLGRHLIRRLAKSGAVIRAAVRDPVAAHYLKPMGDVGQIALVRADVTRPAEVAAAVAGADQVVNLVGILHGRGRYSFDAVHAQAPGHVGRAAAAAGVKRLVHISAIGADPRSPSAYGRSKAAGETALQAEFAGATILRPSLMFGPEDQLFNRFATLARIAPALPLIGGGDTKFQPVYVGDVAQAIVSALANPQAAGRLYELGGPRIYSFRALMEMMLREIGRRRALISVPVGLAKIKAFFLEFLPVPPLTRDQVMQLQQDNLCAAGAPGLAELGISPTACEVILPTYLDRFRSGGKFAAVHRT
jgi:uncharacterized protein YbjT (DUF2867 family)